MANDEHVAIFKKGVDGWNAWRRANPDIRPDLSKADLSGANLGAELRIGAGGTLILSNRRVDLSGADLSGVRFFAGNLRGADLSGALLIRAVVDMANLSGALLGGADLRWAHLFGSDLRGADLSGADLSRADLTGANLSRADLESAILVDTDLTGADLTGCRIYGVSAWRVKVERAKQQALVITDKDEPEITVDNIEVAQFIYLLLHNPKIRDVIDTIGRKAVLILGRFTAERKVVLDALREELRKRDYVPILFDFDKPASQDLTATVSTLAHLARFIIADLTDPSSNRVLNVSVPEPSLQRPGVVAGIGQRIAATVAQHVRMYRELHLGPLSDPAE
jgi:Pentapeptide repeats (8 copies)